jgi:hypothetical protein
MAGSAPIHLQEIVGVGFRKLVRAVAGDLLTRGIRSHPFASQGKLDNDWGDKGWHITAP